jgi:hypothetical protein
MLVSKGMPNTIAALGLVNFLDDIDYKIVYLPGVAQGLSICTNSLLSVVHAITTVPETPCGGDSS